MIGEMPQHPAPCDICEHGPVVADEALSNVCWTCRSHLRWPLFRLKVVEQKEAV